MCFDKKRSVLWLYWSFILRLYHYLILAINKWVNTHNGSFNSVCQDQFKYLLMSILLPFSESRVVTLPYLAKELLPKVSV